MSIISSLLSSRNSNKKTASPEAEMSFFDHLEELRWHLLRITIVLLVLAVAIFWNRFWVFDSIILAPFSPEFPMNRWLCAFDKSLCFTTLNTEFQAISPYEQFTGAMNISLVGAIIVGFPFIVWEFWRFIKPGLNPREKGKLGGTVFVMSFLFLLGSAFSYYVLAPFSVQFLAAFQLSPAVQNQWKIGDVVGLIAQLTVAGGLLFEFPVLVYYLAKLGLVGPEFMRNYRRHAYVVLIILAAIITPPDALSQIMIFIPLVILYEISVRVCVIATRNREKELAA